MAMALNIGKRGAWTICKYVLAGLVFWFLTTRGVHPVWCILLIIYRKAALRILVFLGLLYWLTSSLM